MYIDLESSLGDFGARKYDEDIGRFTSIDPLWEKYYSWTPYHYCSNNPVMGKDPGGKWYWVINKDRLITSKLYNELAPPNAIYSK